MIAKPTSVYVIEAQNGMMKVGHTKNVAGRAATILNSSPVLTRLIAHWPGGYAEEKAIHDHLAAFRSHSEWFALVGEAMAFRNEVFGRGLHRVQEWSEVSFSTSAERMALRRQRMSASRKEFFSNPANLADFRATHRKWAARRKEALS